MTQQHNCRCEIVAEWRLIMDGGIWGKGLLLIKVTRCKSRKVVIHTHKVMEFSHRWIHLPLSLTNPLLKLPFLLNVLRRRCESGLWDLSAVLLFLSPSLSFNDNYNLGHTRGRCTHTHWLTYNTPTHCLVKKHEDISCNLMLSEYWSTLRGLREWENTRQHFITALDHLGWPVQVYVSVC